MRIKLFRRSFSLHPRIYTSSILSFNPILLEIGEIAAVHEVF